MKLKKKDLPLSVEVINDEFVEAAEKAFDCKANGYSEFYPWEKPELVDDFGIGVIVGSSGCLGIGTKVLMYDGTYKQVEDIIVGDVLMGPDSKPRNVLKLFRGREQMYWVRQNKGIDYRVNENHILSLKDRSTKNIRETINGKRVIVKHIPCDETIVNNISIKEFISKSKNFKTVNKGYKSGVLFFNDTPLTIDPYFLGLWLGDGDSDGLSITNIDVEVINYIKEYSSKLNMLLTETFNEDGIGRFLIHKGRIGKNKSNYLINSFKDYNLLNNKHIPLNYLTSSNKNRLELLAGLLDTDGSYDIKRNSFEITQKNDILADNITQLARSLGFYVSNNKSVRKIKSINFEGIYNRIYIYGDLDRIPTKIKRKQAKQSTRNTNWLVSGIVVEKDIIDDYYGFELDGDNLFLLEDLTVTHNSGKSTMLKDFGVEEHPIWLPDKPIMSHFENPDDSINRLTAVGLNSIPSWYRPYHVLSNGEQFRADLARKIKDGAVIDEFTSVVDRNVAKAASVAISRYVKSNNIKNVVLSTCHRDILDWLEPDWVIDTDVGEFTDGFFFIRPKIKIDIYRVDKTYWQIFKDHHYLSGNISNSARCYAAYWGDKLVGFGATMTMPNGYIKNAWRGHRTVILPDYQGMGFGVRLSDAIAQIHLEEGHRYYSRTAHPRMIWYREHSPLWKPTSKHKKLRTDITHKNIFNNHYADNKRICGSFEYVGNT